MVGTIVATGAGVLWDVADAGINVVGCFVVGTDVLSDSANERT